MKQVQEHGLRADNLSVLWRKFETELDFEFKALSSNNLAALKSTAVRQQELIDQIAKTTSAVRNSHPQLAKSELEKIATKISRNRELSYQIRDRARHELNRLHRRQQLVQKKFAKSSQEIVSGNFDLRR